MSHLQEGRRSGPIHLCVLSKHFSFTQYAPEGPERPLEPPPTRVPKESKKMWCRWPPATVGPGGSLPKSAPHMMCPNLHPCAPSARVRHRRPPRPMTVLRPIFCLPGGRRLLLSARPAEVGCLGEPGFGRPAARPTPAIWASRGRRQLPRRPPSPPTARPPRPARPAAVRAPRTRAPLIPLYTRVYAGLGLCMSVYICNT